MNIEINYYNLDKLIKVNLLKKRIPYWYKYFPEKKIFFGLFKQEEGIYSRSYFNNNRFVKDKVFCFINNIPDEYILENNVLWFRPSVTLYFENNYKTTKIFDNDIDAEEFINELKTKYNFIIEE